MQTESTAIDPRGKGPYVQAALLCERVMVEQDGVKTALRIIDRITQTKTGSNPPEVMPPFRANIFLMLKLKAGSCSGKHHLQVQLTRPDGQSVIPVTQTIHFEGDEDQGVDFVGTLQLQFELEGIYWFDFLLDSVLLTRTPLRILYLRRVQQDSASAEQIQ